MSTETKRSRNWSIRVWRRLVVWPAALFVLIYVTQSLWLPLFVPLAMRRARDPRATATERRHEWDFVSCAGQVQ